MTTPSPAPAPTRQAAPTASRDRSRGHDGTGPVRRPRGRRPRRCRRRPGDLRLDQQRPACPDGQLEEIQLPEQSVIYDRTGKVELARFGEFNRDVVTFDQIPPVLVDATTAVEDGSFWDNAGFDTIGIVAAGIDSLRGAPRGASTITQQLVRQRLLTENGTAQTDLSATRKLREIIQSIRVTEAYPGVEGKQRIMAAYLNQNYYGNESYGVAAAAKGYFGVRSSRT